MLQVEIEKLPSFMMGQKRGMEKGLKKGLEKGMAAGERKKALMVARQLLKKNLSLEEIAQVTGLEVAALRSLDQE